MRKGYKAYDKGLICRSKQYEVGQTYEEPEAVICEKGMHYCDNPADVMYYHDLIDADGNIMEVTEVEDLDPDGGEKKDDGYATKYCTKKLNVGAKLSFGEWVRAVVEFTLEKSERKASGYSAQMASSGSDSVVAAIGIGGKAKGALGNWLTLAEWTYSEEKGQYIPVCVKTEYVDGERIKADTWYKLEGGGFTEE